MREAARRKKPVYIHGELSRFPQYEDDKKQEDYRHWRRVTGRTVSFTQHVLAQLKA